MTNVTISIHLRTHRERALVLQPRRRESERVYDSHIQDYLKYLAAEAAKAAYTLATDHGDGESAYSIQAPTHEAKQAAHDWLATLPDIWNWIP